MNWTLPIPPPTGTGQAFSPASQSAVMIGALEVPEVVDEGTRDGRSRAPEDPAECRRLR
jgi:hypothetical protein